MGDMIKRSALPGASGMLCKEHSHSCWVTTDLDRAVEVFRSRFGVKQVQLLEGDSPRGGHIRVAFAWAGGQVLEIICATGPGFEFYNRMLPDDGGFAIRFHHLGFIIHDDAAWAQLEREIADGDHPVVFSTLDHNFIDAHYIEAPELGHYLEYVRPFAAGEAFYNSVPEN